MTLWADFLNNTGRPITKSTHYFPIYEKHFARFVGQPITFIEIGCGAGGSLQMWRRYFGPHATIIGIDINPMCKYFEEEQIFVRIGSQQDESFLQAVLDEFGTPDIVLDDGSHVQGHVVATFNYLYQRVSNRGVYMVEDLHTAYWPEYEGGLRHRGSFIELCKDLVDDLNAYHSRNANPPGLFTKNTVATCFYDGAIVFERGPHRHSQEQTTGNDLEIVKWYRWGVEQGDAWSQRNLGFLYATGKGMYAAGKGDVAQDHAEAVRLFRMAADQGDTTAQLHLGAMTANGQGTPRSPVQALMWCTIAALHGHPNATDVCNTLARNMTQEQIAQARELAESWRPTARGTA
ncbi:MAG: SEL1-like repeat protein [Magnetococcales bacterium]|nr:SEL1-like repeat protein [Magnetococcales bacterium]